jgi:hypothetical protein
MTTASLLFLGELFDHVPSIQHKYASDAFYAALLQETENKNFQQLIKAPIPFYYTRIHMDVLLALRSNVENFLLFHATRNMFVE